MKKVIKSIIFLLIFAMLFYYIFSILWVDKNSASYFYCEPDNSFDIVYLGSSNVYNHFNTVLAYDLYGYTTGIFATAGQSFAMIKFLIKESAKSQNPKLYVIDITKLADDLDSFDDASIRRITDTMKFSKNRIDAINELLKYKNIDKKDYINYYFSFFIYHNRWKNIVEENFTGCADICYKGYIFGKGNTKVVPQKIYQWTTDTIKLQDENELILIDLINYIKSNNLNVIFVIPPRTYTEKINGRLNDAIRIIKENELDIINFNTLEDFNIDFSHELYNANHLNVYGATRYTLYFSRYLKEHYDLPNHKGDPTYNSWNSEYERFKQSYNELTNKDFDDLITQYSI